MEMGTLEHLFIPPPECPVFEPSLEEFKEPLKYIGSIRSVAEKYGICKIKPPPGWRPPFSLDVSKFKFTPRVQRLNELEASTRIKLNFLDKIARFWTLQGAVLKNPHVEKKILDLYTLYKVVQREGGMEKCNQERKWAQVARAMDIPNSKHVAAQLKHHYERILHPFHVFRSGASIGQVKMEEDDADKRDKDYIPHSIASRQAIQPSGIARRSKRCHESTTDSLDEVDYSTNNELRKLQFYGAGPKMPGYCPKASDPPPTNGIKQEGLKTCHGCFHPDLESYLLTCLKCGDCYHLYCLVPRLTEVPRRVWRCPKCVAEEVSKPQEAFGFEQSQKEFTLEEFGAMADRFKADYFKRKPELVPPSEVEREFWRIVGDTDNNISVQYGADLHTIDHGSGFPTKTHIKNLSEEGLEYANSGWNLNELPILEGSIFKYINADISGMKVPWMYVGMCFATFCWHNEDHWSYSINYLHWGEPKTWYGVAGSKAEKFEVAMKAAAPELFDNQPDLLHQLVTIMNPNILMLAGIPVVRTNQHAGEFVITFPRSYHAGFNQGYNFAEAVNFAPADWLAIGRVCVQHYSTLHRFCVFSHDELICTMANDAANLDVGLAASAYYDMLQMVILEKNLRHELWTWGVENAEREHFEAFPDDERQCDYCKTTCYLSALACTCDPKKLVCLSHKEKLCPCPPSTKVLKYRYTLDEMPVMLKSLKSRAEYFDKWVVRTKNFLEAAKDCKCSLSELQYLHNEAVSNRFPDNDYLFQLKATLAEAERCQDKLLEILERKNGLCEEDSSRCQLKQLRVLDSRIDKLMCVIEDSELLKEYLAQCEECYQRAVEIMKLSESTQDLLSRPLIQAQALNLDFPELQQLKERLDQMEWLGSASKLLKKDAAALPFAPGTTMTLAQLKSQFERGKALKSNTLAMRRHLNQMQSLLAQGQSLEETARGFLSSTIKKPIFELEKFVNQPKPRCLKLPTFDAARDVLEQARKLLREMKEIQGSNKSLISQLEKVLAKAQPLPILLEPLQTISDRLEAAWSWKGQALKLFVGGNSSYSGSLLELYIPREDLRRLVNPQEPKTQFDYHKDYTELQGQYRQWGLRELEGVPLLRRNAPGQCTCLHESREITCQLCLKGFHAACVRARREEAVGEFPGKQRRFLCHRCRRTKRPSLAKVEDLLRSLIDLCLCMPEGEALLMLHDRVLNWQERSKIFMQNSEVIPKIMALRKVNYEVASVSEVSPLSEQLSGQLDRLLLEGDLLEVTTQEHVQLSSLWLSCQEPSSPQKISPGNLALSSPISSAPSSPLAPTSFEVPSISLAPPTSLDSASSEAPPTSPAPPSSEAPPTSPAPASSEAPPTSIASTKSSPASPEALPTSLTPPKAPSPHKSPASPHLSEPEPKKRKLFVDKIRSKLNLASLSQIVEAPPSNLPTPCCAASCLKPTGQESEVLLTCKGICRKTYHPGCVGCKSAADSYTCSNCNSPVHRSFDLLNSLKLAMSRPPAAASSSSSPCT